jgi:protein gp37
MAKNSKIEWTTHTFNGWRGCTKVSPGCKNCYAEKLVTTRLKGEWGPGAPRQLASDAMWREPLKWDREAAAQIEMLRPGMSRVDFPLSRPRVFCSSLADVLDHEVPTAWRVRLFALIEATPHLDWLLLTKRPESWSARLHEAASASPFAFRWLNGEVPANLWFGTSVEDQQRADERIPELLSIPARVRFLSCEPLLGPVQIFTAFGHLIDRFRCLGVPEVKQIHWVICGGESGPNARPMQPNWAWSLRDQCEDAGVPFLFKQWGEWDHYGLRVGKKTAGRLLEGVEHNGYPA